MIRILEELDHENILKFHEVFEDEQTIYCVTEICKGHELFDVILELGTLSERDAASIIQKILEAVEYLHDKGIAHRDLKPENVLIESN